MKKIRLSSIHLIPLSFLATILVGALLLTLPFSAADGTWTPLVDALFTATTSVCVTGLVVVDTYSHWSLFGQAVILVLIQVGGLGVITVVSTLMLLTRRKFTLSDRMMLRDAMNLDTLPGLLGFLARVIRGTLIVEMLGAFCYMFSFIPRFGPARGIWASIWGAVSAFCNAGMDVLGPDSLFSYREDPLILTVTMALIVMGGLGYVVWFDLAQKATHGVRRSFSPKQVVRRLSEHTKLVLVLTLVLIFGGAVVIFAAEYSNPRSLGNLSLPMKLLNSLFESVTLRTAGFATFSQRALTDISCIVAYILMFIGGSPIGTAGGVKTTTFYLAILNVTTYLHEKNEARSFRRSISAGQMKKASVIVEVSAFTVLILTLLLLATNRLDIKNGLFEIISACATVGLTRDVTGTLNTAGKLIVTFAMYLGRIGPISMAIFLAGGTREENAPRYAEGNFYIG